MGQEAMLFAFSVFLLAAILALVVALVAEDALADHALKKREAGSEEDPRSEKIQVAGRLTQDRPTPAADSGAP
jgi:hypothetical protein